jgi:hypothetical protein
MAIRELPAVALKQFTAGHGGKWPKAVAKITATWTCCLRSKHVK